MVELAFAPSLDVRLRVLKKHAAAEGFDIDEISEKFLDMLLDSPGFSAYLAKMNDPETGEPLITRKTKKDRTKNIAQLLS
jgi:hypothetical protein